MSHGTAADICDLAKQLARAGISVVPVPPDGSKAPAVSWKKFQERIANDDEIDALFPGQGIATIGGAVSSNLEILDIDNPALVEPFERLVRELAPGLLENLHTTATPRDSHGGRHYRYRIAGQVPGNTKLAESEPLPKIADGSPCLDKDGKPILAPVTWIETRGEGGVAVAPGSPPACHESGLPYKHIAGPNLTDLRTITDDDHQTLMRAARSFNRNVAATVKDELPQQRASQGRSPGDVFNEQATWQELLEPAGWQLVHSSGELSYWRRPGKAKGWSATTGCKSKSGNELLCVFSSNAHPFEGAANGRPCSSYTKFAAYAYLNHGGDFSAAAKALATEGYGERPAPGETAGRTEPPAKKRCARPLPVFERFPVGLLPDPLGAYVTACSASLQCDLSFIALPLLTAAAAAIGNTRRIRLSYDWTEPPIIWTGIVGESGVRKTPALLAGTYPLHNFQDKAFREYERDLQHYERELQSWEAQFGGRRKSATGGAPPPKPEAPIPVRFIVGDVTCEALAERLNEQPRGLLSYCDELSGLFGRFDRYSSNKSGQTVSSDVAHYLSMYNGSSVIIDRKTSRKHIYVRRASLCITGGIQPEVLQRCFSQQNFENGLAARFLLTFPPKYPRVWREQPVSDTLKRSITDTFASLVDLQFTESFNGGESPIELPIDADAKAIWREFYNDHANEQAGLGGSEAALWSKLEGTAARLALIIHLVRSVSRDRPAVPEIVDKKSMESAIGLVRWFGAEGRRIYSSLAESSAERNRRQLIELVKRKGGCITARELAKACRSYGGKAEVAGIALQTLVNEGDGEWQFNQPGAAGGRPTSRFVLSPVHMGEALPEDEQELDGEQDRGQIEDVGAVNLQLDAAGCGVGETPSFPQDFGGFGYADI